MGVGSGLSRPQALASSQRQSRLDFELRPREVPFSLHVGPRSSGNAAFDRWRTAELARLDAERGKLVSAEREFVRYRDELLHAKDREDFERFMNARGVGRPAQ